MIKGLIDKTKFEELAAQMHPAVAATAQCYPATTCYRRKLQHADHLAIASYYRTSRVGEEVALFVVHGGDSVHPGVKEMHVMPTELVSCGCGEWSWPTEEQVAKAAKHAPYLNAAPHRPFAEYASQPIEAFDPNEALALYYDAMRKRSPAAAIGPFLALLGWFQRRGAQPDWEFFPGMKEHFATWIPN